MHTKNVWTSTEVAKAFFESRAKQSTSLASILVTNIKELPIPVPPADEQRAIADYLDREIARLDKLVAAKKRVLGLAVEKRRALITRAVARGLDPHTPLCDPGIPWLGEIPSPWALIPLRFLVDIVGGATPDTGKAEFWNGDIPSSCWMRARWRRAARTIPHAALCAPRFLTQGGAW